MQSPKLTQLYSISLPLQLPPTTGPAADERVHNRPAEADEARDELLHVRRLRLEPRDLPDGQQRNGGSLPGGRPAQRLPDAAHRLRSPLPRALHRQSRRGRATDRVRTHRGPLGRRGPWLRLAAARALDRRGAQRRAEGVARDARGEDHLRGLGAGAGRVQPTTRDALLRQGQAGLGHQGGSALGHREAAPRLQGYTQRAAESPQVGSALPKVTACMLRYIITLNENFIDV